MIIRTVQCNLNEIRGIYHLEEIEVNNHYCEDFVSWVDSLIIDVCKYSKIEYLQYTDWRIQNKTSVTQPNGWDWLWYSPNITEKTLSYMREGGGQIWLKPYYGQNLARVSNFKNDSILDNESDFFEAGTF